MFPGDQAGLVAGKAIATNDGARVVDHAGRRDSNSPFQSGAPIAGAQHPPIVMIGMGAGNARERVLVFQAESRPFRRVGATRTACPAILGAERARAGRGGRLAQRRRAFRAA